MMTDWQAHVIALLQAYAEEHLGETELAEQEDTVFLRLAPALFTDGTGQVLMEVCLVDYGEEITVAQIYTTVLPQLGSGAEALRACLPEWNFTSMAGSYGIYEKEGHLYHKQNIALINDAAADDQADFLFTGLCLAMDEMARRYPEAVAMTDGQV